VHIFVCARVWCVHYVCVCGIMCIYIMLTHVCVSTRVCISGAVYAAHTLLCILLTHLKMLYPKTQTWKQVYITRIYVHIHRQVEFTGLRFKCIKQYYAYMVLKSTLSSWSRMIRKSTHQKAHTGR